MGRSARAKGRQRKNYLELQPDVPREPLRRQDVAHRQINSAIDILVGGGDWLAAHVLSMAALDVVEREAAARGLQTMMAADIASYPVEVQEPYRVTLKGAYNFAKHGGEEVFEHYTPVFVPLLLLVAASTYWEVYGWPADGWLKLTTWFHEEMPDALGRPSILIGGPMDWIGRRG